MALHPILTDPEEARAAEALRDDVAGLCLLVREEAAALPVIPAADYPALLPFAAVPGVAGAAQARIPGGGAR